MKVMKVIGSLPRWGQLRLAPSWAMIPLVLQRGAGENKPVERGSRAPTHGGGGAVGRRRSHNQNSRPRSTPSTSLPRPLCPPMPSLVVCRIATPRPRVNFLCLFSSPLPPCRRPASKSRLKCPFSTLRVPWNSRHPPTPGLLHESAVVAARSAHLPPCLRVCVYYDRYLRGFWRSPPPTYTRRSTSHSLTR